MTRRTNRRFLLIGAAAVFLMLLAVQIHAQTGVEIARHLVGVFMAAAFVFLIILGLAPWVGTLVLKYPLQDTRGYREDYAAEPEKEAGLYASQGWRRKRERAGLRNLKAFGLYIEPDEKT
jgi:hypothetical protein